MPAAVWLYLSWYVAPLLILRTDRTRFRRAAVAVLVSFLACAAGWSLLPVSMDRPRLDGGGGPSIVALRAVYAIDPPSGLFPSFHAALAAIIVRVPWRSRLARAAQAAWMCAICVSCLLTKQHYVLDVLSGVVVGLLTAVTVDRCAHYLAGLRESPATRLAHLRAVAKARTRAPNRATQAEPEVPAP